MLECRLIGLKNNELHYECKGFNDESYKSINGLIKKFPNTYQFCKDDLKNIVLLLRKGVYPYEYMDIWEKFNETSLPDKEAFYSKLYKDGITDEDYTCSQSLESI